MRNHFRALSVEPVEDRSLPSTLLAVEPMFGSHPYNAGAATASFAHQSRGLEQARSFQADFFAESFIRVQFSNNGFVFIQETPTGFTLIPVTVTISTPVTTPQGPTGDGGGSAGGSGQTGGDGGVIGTGNGPVASPHGPARTGATSSPAPGTGDVAFTPTADSANATRATTADQAAASAAAQVAVQNTQPVVAQGTPTVAGHAAYAITAIVPEAEDGADVTPPANPTPTPDPDPTPVPDMGVSDGVVQVAAAAVAPVAGLLPIDLPALSAGTTQFLGRVAELAPVWPDAMPGFDDTLWVAAAALLTGGGVYAAGARSAAKPTPDPVAGALSEWERRHGRATG
jgi:hypothetical protein